MNDALLVCGLHCVGDLFGDWQGFIGRYRALRDPLGERRPVDQLHNERLDALDCSNPWTIAMFG